MRRLIVGLLVLVVVVVFGPPVATRLFGLGPDPRLRPLPGRMVAVADGLSINVVEAGSGPPVVLVHGLPSNAYDWHTLPEKLAAKGYRVIAYDRVGYGYSSRSADSPDRYTLASNAADLAALLDALQVQRATLVGWSYGGGVVQLLARNRPDRVTNLVLVAAVGPAQPPPPDDALNTVLLSPVGASLLQWVSAVPPLSRQLIHDGMIEVFSRPEAIPPGWEEYTRAMLALPGTMDSFVLEAQRERYAQLPSQSLRVPTLILQGTDDRSVPPAVAADLHRRIAGSELVMVPDGCHMLPVTHPDLLAEQMHAFLRHLSSGHRN